MAILDIEWRTNPHSPLGIALTTIEEDDDDDEEDEE